MLEVSHLLSADYRSVAKGWLSFYALLVLLFVAFNCISEIFIQHTLFMNFEDILKNLDRLSKNGLNLFSKDLGFESYDSLADVIYNTPNVMQYHKFSIPKRNGNLRDIAMPKRRLKKIQNSVLKLLTPFYLPPECPCIYFKPKYRYKC